MHRPSSLFRDQRGAVAIEFALVVPLLLTILLGAVTMFDLYRGAQNADKATFTIGDIVSRQTVMNTAMLTSMHNLLKHSVSGSQQSAIRVSSITKTNTGLVAQWTKTVGPVAAINGAAIPYSIVPNIAVGDSVVLTETFVPRKAIFSGFGVGAFNARTRAAHRPRFVATIAWQN
jgi:Flp pilus assembly protein TadG